MIGMQRSRRRDPAIASAVSCPWSDTPAEGLGDGEELLLGGQLFEGCDRQAERVESLDEFLVALGRQLDVPAHELDRAGKLVNVAAVLPERDVEGGQGITGKADPLGHDVGVVGCFQSGMGELGKRALRLRTGMSSASWPARPSASTFHFTSGLLDGPAGLGCFPAEAELRRP